jgi:hypothetical protein
MGKFVAAGVGIALLVILLVGAATMSVVAAVFGGGVPAPGDIPVGCSPVGMPGSASAGYRPDQLDNAATIVAVGKRMRVPEQGGIATAIQESGLRNLNYGDRDSLGLFQQRPSQGWGTPAQIMTPTYAATQFYRHLLAVPHWQQLSVIEAAQAVQHSAFPDAYASHEQAAREIVATVSGATCAPSPVSVSVNP